MDKRELSSAFQLLDSPDIKVVNDFVESLKLYEKDSWVVENLITYYMNTQSRKAAELIARSRSEHDKVIFRKLHNCFSDKNSRQSCLKLLLYIVSKKPPWLYKITDEHILRDVFSCLKCELNVAILLDSLYITTMLLPVVPDGMVKYFDEIFDNLLRLTHLAFYNKEGLPEIYLLHLNVGIYSLFARLYGMYPWHYINSLHDSYSKRKIQPEFYKKAVEPMLSTVKLNPGLITASRESELRGDQWRKKEMHDIIAECASLSLEVTETTRDYDSRCPVLITRDPDKMLNSALKGDKDSLRRESSSFTHEASAPIELSKDSLVLATVNSSTFFSPSDRLGLSTPPATDSASAVVEGPTHFTVVAPRHGTPQQNTGPAKTPHNSSGNTPRLSTPTTQYTPKNTPTIDSGGASSRSRHTSGTKTCMSRLSIDESVPPSPLRKEFTSEPPMDIPKISATAESGTGTTAPLSITNLPHILEKISDTGSCKTHETDTSNTNTDDEEVESITKQQADPQTAQAVAEFWKTVNRIRYLSLRTSESDSDKFSRGGSLKRADSCPEFSEEMLEETEGCPVSKLLLERSVSNQTTSANDQMLATESPAVTSAPATGQGQLTPATTTPITSELLESELLASNLSVTSKSISTGRVHNVQRTEPGPGALLDNHIMLLNDQLKLGSAVHRQHSDTCTRRRDTNWTHFGVSVPTDEASIARAELVLLHTQLLYERQKRELHAERNRRMLSKIAKAEKMKENNKSLEEQLSRSRDDIFNLQTTIRLQSNEIQRMKNEKSRSDASKEQELTALIKENERLKYANEDLKNEFTSKVEQFKRKAEELQLVTGERDSLLRELDAVQSDNNKYRKFEEEVCRMKKELLLMGEIQLKYQEKLSALKYDNQMAVAYSNQEVTYIADITKLKENLQKMAEACQLKQSQLEVLSSTIKDKDKVISEQQKRIQMMQAEHACRLQAVEDKFEMSQSARQALEVQIMSLLDQIGKLSTPAVAKERPNSSLQPVN